MERIEGSPRFPIGSKMPDFHLRGTDNKMYSTEYFQGAKARLVIFTCNHCPYVKGSEQALIEVYNHHKTKGLKALAICSNDASKYPDDDFSKMQEKSKGMNLPYPYLHDESQLVAKKFDAQCTPECYLFNDQNELVFHGTINDNPREASLAKKTYLKTAIEQLLSGQQVSPAFAHPIGCSIKWR